jgi:hypothetical protein
MNETWRCHQCGDVIGMYEPLITLVDGQPRETSRAVAQSTAVVGEECYHRACYAHWQRDDPVLK